MKIKLMRVSITLLTLLLTACSVKYQAQNGSGVGYKSTALPDGSIVLYYYGNSQATAAIIKQHWQQRAGELCPQGYNEIELSTFKEFGTMRSPVMGRMETLGTVKIHGKGKLRCKSSQANI
jgi:hypothetical protein